MKTAIKFIALIATGLLAGAFFYTFVNLLPTFNEVPVNVHLIFRVQLMSHNGITMQTLMGLSIIGPLTYAWLNKGDVGARNFALLTSGLALSALLVTRFGNVPINQIIRTWEPDAPPVGFRTILERWDSFHLVRTCAGIASFITMIIATNIKRAQ